MQPLKATGIIAASCISTYAQSAFMRAYFTVLIELYALSAERAGYFVVLCLVAHVLSLRSLGLRGAPLLPTLRTLPNTD